MTTKKVACEQCGKKYTQLGMAAHLRITHGVPKTGGPAMPDPEVVTRAELDIRDLRAENARLTSQLETASAHRRLGEIIAHAGDACTDCRQDLEQYNQRIIKAGLEGLDPAAVRELALKKGVLPKVLTFQVP